METWCDEEGDDYDDDCSGIQGEVPKLWCLSKKKTENCIVKYIMIFAYSKTTTK